MKTHPTLSLVLLSALLLSPLLGGCAFRVSTRPLVSAQGVPLVASACRDGGWQTLRNDLGEPFKNQGECISFTHKSG